MILFALLRLVSDRLSHAARKIIDVSVHECLENLGLLLLSYEVIVVEVDKRFDINYLS